MGIPPTSAPDPESGKLFFLRLTDAGMRRLAVPLDGPVGDLLDAVSMGPRLFPAVVAHVAERAGIPAEAADKRVRQAVGQGLLCTFHEAEDGSADYDDLLTPDDPRATTLAAGIRAGLPRLADAPAPERGGVLAELRGDLGKLSHLAGRPAQITVEEDYVMPPLKVATRQWHEPLADLGPAVELLSVFDWLHDVRVLMTAAFVERFGAGANIPLAANAAFVVGEVSRRAAAMDAVYGPHGTGDPSALAGIGPADGSLERMYLLRRELTEAVHARLSKTVDAGDDTLVLTPDDVAGLTASLPDRFRQDPLIYGVLLQEGDGRLVLNDGLPGHGMLYARFLDADRRMGGRALPRLAGHLQREYGFDGARVTEDLGLHRLNVNAHAPILPGGLTPEDWFTLRLAHDPDTDTLRVEDADGAPLRVLRSARATPACSRRPCPSPRASPSAAASSTACPTAGTRRRRGTAPPPGPRPAWPSATSSSGAAAGTAATNSPPRSPRDPMSTTGSSRSTRGAPGTASPKRSSSRTRPRTRDPSRWAPPTCSPSGFSRSRSTST